MPEYSGFLKGFFLNHAGEDRNMNYLRYLIYVRMLFEVEEDMYAADVEDARKLFEAYDAITGKGRKKRETYGDERDHRTKRFNHVY